MSRPGRPSGCYTQAARVRRVEALLWAHERVSLDELAAGVGVTPRTVRRDLDALREAGLAVRVEDCHAALTQQAVAADPAVRAVARHLRAEITRSASEGEPDVVRHALAEIAAGIERGEIGLAMEQQAEGVEVACG